jgi:tetratricopeptide (TPR) repeat protein
LDSNNPVIKQCIEGSRAEFEGKRTEAFQLYHQAWVNQTNDYEGSIAAHYVARTKEIPEDILFWNMTALALALKSESESVKDFFPSLYLNLGNSYEQMGEIEQAKVCFKKAIDKAGEISESHAEMVKNAISENHLKLKE